MDLGIDGKIAIVSGASRGIGFAIARSLAREGARVVMAARDASALEEAVEAVRGAGGTALGVPADMTDRDAIAEVVNRAHDEYGKIAIAVANVASPRATDLANTTDEEFEAASRQLIISLIRLCRAVIPDMREQGWGRIVNIGSDCAKEVHRGIPLIAANTFRPATLGFLKTLSADLGPAGITVNSILIGAVATETRRQYYQDLAQAEGVTPEELKGGNPDDVPVRRFGTPEEVGALCAFLCSVHAGYLSGEAIAANGGRNRTLF